MQFLLMQDWAVGSAQRPADSNRELLELVMHM
jgi:hypothetical protein